MATEDTDHKQVIMKATINTLLNTNVKLEIKAGTTGKAIAVPTTNNSSLFSLRTETLTYKGG